MSANIHFLNSKKINSDKYRMSETTSQSEFEAISIRTISSTSKTIGEKMAKRKTTVGATNGSMSPESSTLKEGNKTIPQESTPEEENTMRQDTNPAAECVNEEGDTPE